MEYRMPELIWDRASAKVLVFIEKATGIEATMKDGTSSTHCKISSGKTSFKTKVVKKSLNPVYEEFFLFDMQETEGLQLTFEIWDVQKKKFLGLGKMANVSSLEKETVHLMELKLEARSDSSKKDQVNGLIKVRLYISDQVERRPKAMAERQKNRFFYEYFIDQFRTGDLILFSGYGVLDAAVRIQENSEYSRAGLLVKLTNQYTEKIETYILEVTRNTDGMLDVFREKSGMGLCLFRLEERLHQYHGKSIHWCRMSESMSARALTDFKRFIMNHHRELNESNISNYFTPSHTLIHRWLAETFKIGKHPAEVIDLFSIHFIIKALGQAGMSKEVSSSSLLRIHTLTELPCYANGGPARPLRLPENADIPTFFEKELKEIREKNGRTKDKTVLSADEKPRSVSLSSPISDAPDFLLFHKYIAELAQTQAYAFEKGGAMDMPELQQTARDSIGITMNNKEEPTSKRSSGLSSSPTPSSSHDAVSENSENALEGGALRRSRGLAVGSELESPRPEGVMMGGARLQTNINTSTVLNEVSPNTQPAYSTSSHNGTSGQVNMGMQSNNGVQWGMGNSQSAYSSSSSTPQSGYYYNNSFASDQSGNSSYGNQMGNTSLPANPYASSAPSPADVQNYSWDEKIFSSNTTLGNESVNISQPSFHEMQQDELTLLERSVLAEVDEMLQQLY